jgi:hypothetical protein
MFLDLSAGLLLFCCGNTSVFEQNVAAKPDRIEGLFTQGRSNDTCNVRLFAAAVIVRQTDE